MIELRKIVASEMPAFRQANIDAMVAGLSHYQRRNEQAVIPFCETKIDMEIDVATQTDLETILSIVKTDTQQVVGSIWYRLHTDAVYDDLVFICWLGIYPQYRQSGFAKAALKQLELDLNKQGINRMALQAFDHHCESMNLYKSCGFEPKRTILHKYFDHK
ncbi:MAG: GNAT family N-acetyltransferase [Gammaproteobacteria bacterium]